ncbi:hemolysin family protein [Photobacterium carnosum]|uniref:Hemolysin n=1 Tax=Photobacterium carnosum TaxID=2023717 RepID=A0A2N4UWW2_9GAMM|nr:hemolysin family protein [Photobacterium carnosum]KAE8178604.1 hypothetical protein CIT27_02235 [Photobacterium carnosum]MBY3786904.1 HlyC/CorC family transporter [Photobacterium carnosum]MCD9493911.1 DUF21 domain-containing protein [Photobacterium carnosum]MCD9515407.1 DUF21 domain-containing protein [Photobacterium carnosum]MCD9521436.1 DUF21 domain-containing protein [Photobacterium carnosum]
MSIAILIFLVILNGWFAMSEIALVTSRKNRLQVLADEGDIGAMTAIKLANKPTTFLSTIQIGITIIGILNGVIGEAALAGPISSWLTSFGVQAHTASVSATIIAVVVLTYFSIVIGELIPKRYAQVNAEPLALRVARPIAFLSLLSRPFIILLAGSTELFLRVFSKNTNNSTHLTEDDIKAIITEGSQAGIIHQQEHTMVRNVFHFDDRKISSMMTPRNAISYLDLDHSVESYQQKLLASPFSCLPVCNHTIDDIKGTITAKQLLKFELDNNSEAPKNIIDYITQPLFIPETWTGTDLLDMFQDSGTRIAFVVDEYGDIQGIVTPRDVLEALTGKFNTQDPSNVWSKKITDNNWHLDGLVPITVVKDLLDLKKLPDEDQNGYQTLNGMLMWIKGGLPKNGDIIDWQRWRFEILVIEHNRIEKVNVYPRSSTKQKK